MLVGPGAAPGSGEPEPQSHSRVLGRFGLAQQLLFLQPSPFIFLHLPVFVDPSNIFPKAKWNEVGLFSSRELSSGPLHEVTILFFDLLVTHRWVYSDSWTSDLHQFPFPSVLPLSSLCHPWGPWRLHHGTEGKSHPAFHRYPGCILHSQCQLQPRFWWQCLWQWPCFPPYGSSFVSNCPISQNTAGFCFYVLFWDCCWSEVSSRTAASLLVPSLGLKRCQWHLLICCAISPGLSLHGRRTRISWRCCVRSDIHTEVFDSLGN